MANGRSLLWLQEPLLEYPLTPYFISPFGWYQILSGAYSSLYLQKLTEFYNRLQPLEFSKKIRYVATFRWDSATDVDIKNFSVREIQPPQ